MRKFTSIMALGAVMAAGSLYAAKGGNGWVRAETLENHQPFMVDFVSDQAETEIFPNLLADYKDRVYLAPTCDWGYVNYGLSQSSVVSLTLNKDYSDEFAFYGGNHFNSLLAGDGNRFRLAYGNGTLGLAMELSLKNDGSHKWADSDNGFKNVAGQSATMLTYVKEYDVYQFGAGLVLLPSFGLQGDKMDLNLSMPIGLATRYSGTRTLESDNVNEVERTTADRNLNPLSLIGLNGKATLKGDDADLVIKGSLYNRVRNLRSTTKVENKAGNAATASETITKEDDYNATMASVGVGRVAQVKKTLLVAGVDLNPYWSNEEYLSGNTAKKEYEFDVLIPVTVGIEQEVNSWAKVRGSVSRYLYNYSRDYTKNASYTGGTRTDEQMEEAWNDVSYNGWNLALGAGIEIGSIVWDTKIENSCTGLSDVIADTSLTYKW